MFFFAARVGILPRIALNIIGIGEVLWDLLPAGRQLGGAPANFAFHTRALGAYGAIISRVGDDENGRDILRTLGERGVPPMWVQVDPAAPTGTVAVALRDGQPEYTIHEDVAWDRIVADEGALKIAAKADAVCFGTLAQRCETSRAAIYELLSATRENAVRVLDANLRQSFFTREILERSLDFANILKVNEHELPVIAGMFEIGGDEDDQIERLALKFGLRMIALTRGDRGSVLFCKGEWSDHPGAPARVADTIGAGDLFAAAMILGILRGWNLDAVNAAANQVAAYVASQPGGMPDLPKEIRALFKT